MVKAGSIWDGLEW